MKKAFKGLLVMLVAILGYVLYVFSSTGYFRTIENTVGVQVVKKISIAGVEDITVDEDDDFAIFISYDRAAERDGNPKQGGIYMMDFKKDYAYKSLSSDMDLKLLPHGISLFQVDSTKHKLYVVNHAVGEAIEVFDLFHRDSLVHVKTLKNEKIYSINDIVAVSENEFYFTNDHYYHNTLGQLAENYLGLAKCETVYFDGNDYRVVNNTIAYANGINYDAKRKLLFIASPRGFLIEVFKRLDNGGLEHLDTIDANTGVDNLEFDSEGNLWSGCHPNLLVFNAYSKGKKPHAPSEVIKIDYRGKDYYSVETTFLDEGTTVSASTVAAIYKDVVLVGNVMDSHFLVLTIN